MESNNNEIKTNKYTKANLLISLVHLKSNDSILEKNIGRYARFKDKNPNLGLLSNLGMIYEIIAIQNHWGYVDGHYSSNKVGYRIVEVGNTDSFGKVGDVDLIEFINFTEKQAISKNKQINKSIAKMLDLN